MQTLIEEAGQCRCSPEALAASLRRVPGLVLLESRPEAERPGRYSLVAARPFLTVTVHGAVSEVRGVGEAPRLHFGDPWCLLEELFGRYELTREADLPFPTGACVGYWGYGLGRFVEPSLRLRALADLALPDGFFAFYASLVVFDHSLGTAWIVATGLSLEGGRSLQEAELQAEWWRDRLREVADVRSTVSGLEGCQPGAGELVPPRSALASFSRQAYLAAVRAAQDYIRRGHIYQVNLAQRLTVETNGSPWDIYRRLSRLSPAPYAAFLSAGDFALCSASPELFLKFSGGHVTTRPIKGTRPRSGDAFEDQRLSAELQTSSKELAELTMIVDLLRNDLGRVCEYGSVNVPELVRLERFAQVQHLVATVEGDLRPEVSHVAALRACFPGGSVTGAPKLRAMEIIDELEPVARGPYTGALGYLGFNQESQLSVLIRVAIAQAGQCHFSVGAGIVADSVPEAEYEETLAKAEGFRLALGFAPIASEVRHASDRLFQR